MNPLQQVLLNIFTQYAEVCARLGLTYFAFGGTLLGAIRHEGFIPWDDDMDLAMPRKDYDRFVESAQELLPDYLLLQTSGLDAEGYPLPFAKIRDIRTTMIEPEFKNATFNQGCWIDVFPLDSINSAREMAKKRRRKRRLLLKRVMLRYEPFRPKSFKTLLVRWKVLFLCPSRKKAVESLRTFYINHDDDCDCLVHNNGFLSQRIVFKKEWFSQAIIGTFEKLPIFLPVGYVEILENQYGDWRQMPSLGQRRAKHGCLVALDKPFSPASRKQSLWSVD